MNFIHRSYSLYIKIKLQTVKYLLSISGVKMGASITLNQSGFTAFDTLEHIPKDFKSLVIQNAFQDVGLKEERNNIIIIISKKYNLHHRP